ncbi:MAG: hypothetical protein D6797_09735 [Bdellovibrio sp.]|nr:MAG: hypothetical protein D6797_09735 [Bdellovibrio sp.]
MLFFRCGIIIFSFYLAACWGPRPKGPEEQQKVSGASFYVYEAGGRPRSRVERHHKWNIPYSKNYSFYVCLKDSLTDVPVRSQRFYVSKDKKSFGPFRTDENGCLSWVENISFNYFKKTPAYIYEPRWITTLSQHSGKVPVHFVLNPWLQYRGGSMSAEVVYLNKNNFSSEEKKKLLSERDVVNFKEPPVSLWVDEPQIFVRDVKELISSTSKTTNSNLDDTQGVHLEVHLKTKVRVQLEDAAGQPYTLPLNTGTFRVEAVLLAKGFDMQRSEKPLILTPEVPPEMAEVNPADGYLRVKINTILTRRVYRGSIYIALRVIPVQLPSFVKISKFDGLYLLKHRYSKILGHASTVLTSLPHKKDASFNYSQYLKTAVNFSKYLKTREAFKLDPYIFRKLNVRFQTIKRGETATTRTVLFRVTTCVLDSFGDPVPFEKFEIKILRNSKLNSKALMRQPDPPPPFVRETDEEGCLSWMDEITHKYYKPEDYVFPEAIVTNWSQKQRALKEGKKPFSKRLTMVVNPWDEKWTFGADKRSLLDSYVRSIRQRRKIESRFFVAEYSYQTIRFLYNINRFMDLKVKKTVLLRFRPKALRYNSIVRGRTTEPLRDGIYLMKVALHKPYLDPASKGIQIKLDRQLGTHVIVPTDENKDVEYDDNSGGFLYTTYTGTKVKIKEHISVIQKLVRVQNGQVITPITFSINDLRLMKIRSQLFIQLETIDETKLLAANVFKKKTDEKLKELSEYIREDKVNEEVLKRCWLQKNPNFKMQLRIKLDFLKQRRLEHSLELAKKNGAPKEIIEDLERSVREFAENYKNYRDGLMTKLVENINASRINQFFIDMRNGRIQFGATSDQDLMTFINESQLSNKYMNDICLDIQKEILEEMSLNDFTIYPAAPIVDLNLLVDKDSGLKKRTFVGPLTLIFNSNFANMRATDNLDENLCKYDDCNQLTNSFGEHLEKEEERVRRNKNYEDSSLFGSLKYAVNLQVDDLIKRKVQMMKNYIKEMKVESLLYNLVKFQKMIYVSLSGKPDFKLKKYTCGPLTQERLSKVHLESDCFQKTEEFTLSLQGLLKKLNISQIQNQVTKHDLERMVDTKVASPDLQERLCRVLAEHFIQVNEDLIAQSSSLNQWYKKAIQKGNKWLKKLSLPYRLGGENKVVKRVKKSKLVDLTQSCLFFINKNRLLDITAKYRVKETGAYRYKGGKSMNITVMDAFSMFNNRALHVSGEGGLFGTVSVGKGISGGGSVRIGWGGGMERGKSANINVQSATFLVMQTAAFDLQLLRYEKCVAIKWSPEFKNIKSISELAKEANKEGKTLYYPVLFLCKGQYEDKPINVREKYYYFTQHFTAGDMLDPGDLYNHPWLLALRGVREFRAFITMITKDKVAKPVPSDTLERLLLDPLFGDTYKTPVRYQWSIDRLSYLYQKVLPTFPGIYTDLGDEGLEDDQYPWRNKPDDSIHEDGSFWNEWDLEPVPEEAL